MHFHFECVCVLILVFSVSSVNPSPINPSPINPFPINPSICETVDEQQLYSPDDKFYCAVPKDGHVLVKWGEEATMFDDVLLFGEGFTLEKEGFTLEQFCASAAW